jgi:nitrite reductase/ring-hydroxylating ferredoxin subunit
MAAEPGEINAAAMRQRRWGKAEESLRRLPASDIFRTIINVRVRNMAEWFVAKSSEMKDGDRRIVTAGKREIGVFHKSGAYYAYSNICLHQGGPACEGMLTQNVVDVFAEDRTYQGQVFGDEMHFVCPWHGYEYDIKTGECIGDRRLKLRKFEVVKRGEDIYVVA